MSDSRLGIALADAAKNCREHSSVKAVITLRSGVQYTGRLEHNFGTLPDTVHLYLAGGGWVTVLESEIVAVESTRGG